MEIGIMSAILGLQTVVFLIVGLIAAIATVKGRKAVEKGLSLVEENYQKAMDLLEGASGAIEALSPINEQIETVSVRSKEFTELSKKIAQEADSFISELREESKKNIVMAENWTNALLETVDEFDRTSFTNLFQSLAELSALIKGFEIGIHYFFKAPRFGVKTGAGKTGPT